MWERVRLPDAQSEAMKGVESTRSWPLEMLRTWRWERKGRWSAHESWNPGREQLGPTPKGYGTGVYPQREGQSGLRFAEIEKKKRKKKRMGKRWSEEKSFMVFG